MELESAEIRMLGQNTVEHCRSEQPIVQKMHRMKVDAMAAECGHARIWMKKKAFSSRYALSVSG
jgi:hypothetical protein